MYPPVNGARSRVTGVRTSFDCSTWRSIGSLSSARWGDARYSPRIATARATVHFSMPRTS